MTFNDGISRDHPLFGLESIVENPYGLDNAFDSCVKRDFSSDLLEIKSRYGKHLGNGLLLTRNGYFVTANHCLGSAQLLSKIAVEDHLGTQYEARVLHRDVKHDVALAQIPLGEDSAAFGLSFYDFNEGISVGTPVQVFYRQEMLYCASGTVSRNSIGVQVSAQRIYVDQLQLTLDGRRGFSGGVAATRHGALLGVVSAGEPTLWCSVVKSNYIVDCIKDYLGVVLQ